jgi:very-short-patch-repair endonuclease
MRREPAPAEQKLWWCLRDRRLGGFKFRRQVSIGSYVADFYCADCRLIIELDGDSHSDQQEYDEHRTVRLRGLGLSVIRFVNTDVFENLDSVRLAILRECESRTEDARAAGKSPSPLPSPLSTGERE